jgi:RepB DNA-primase from phage plasmid
MPHPPDTDAARVEEAERYLQTLRESAPPDTHLEVRHSTETGFSRYFTDINNPDAANTITQIGEQNDVYVGIAAREQKSGTRADIAPTSLVWADCDTPESLQALREFPHPPSMIVNSGSEEHAHAYWALTEPLPVKDLEDINRGLAQKLGADPKCTDASRILRPPGTNNFKHDPPQPVQLSHHTDTRYDPQEISDAAPPVERDRPQTPTQPKEPNRPAREHTRTEHHGRSQDPLHKITPPEYIQRLTGREPQPDGKINCPFHPDTTPSLHAYDTPERGWACYGCPTPDGHPAGGDIYNFASQLWDIPTHGQDFLDLRDRLDETFGIER